MLEALKTYLDSLTIKVPHALSLIATIGVAVCVALGQSPSPLLTPYDVYFKDGAIVLGFLAAPNLSHQLGAVRDGSLKAWWNSLEATMPHALSGWAALGVAGFTALSQTVPPLFPDHPRLLGTLIILCGFAASPNIAKKGSLEASPVIPPPPQV